MTDRKTKIELHSGYNKNLIGIFAICEVITAGLKLAVVTLLGESIEYLISENKVYTGGVICAILLAISAVLVKRVCEVIKRNYERVLVQRECESFFEKYKRVKNSAEIDGSQRLQMVNESIGAIVRNIIDSTPKLIGIAISLACYVIYGLSISAVITILITLLGCVVTRYQYKENQKNVADYEKGEELEAKANEYMRKAVENAEVAEVMLDSEKIAQEAKHKLTDSNNVWLNAMETFFKSASIGTYAYHITGFITIGIGVAEVIRGHMLIGNIFVIFQMAQMIMSYITQLSELYQEMSATKGTCRFMEVFWKQEEWSGKNKKTQIKEISIEDVTFRYGTDETAYVLKNITAVFEAGKFYKISGKNGSGKSTLAKIMAGMVGIQEGNIYVDGIHMGEIEKESYMNAAKYCGQNTIFFPGTVLENIAGVDGDEERVQQLLADIGCEICNGLSKRLHEKMELSEGKFSAGEKQMITFVRSLCGTQPSFLILDEIIANMDEASQKSVLKFLNGLCKKGVGIILITHNQLQENEFSINLQMTDGQLVEEG